MAGISALRADEALDGPVKLHGFVDAGAWVSAALKINGGIMQCLLSDIRKEIEGAILDKSSAEYKAATEQMSKEMVGLRQAWGPLTPAEQKVMADALEDVRLTIAGERPQATDALGLEQVQRWVACAKDPRVTPTLDLTRGQFAEDPTALRRQIALAAVKPEVDAAAREQGFSGAHEWGRATVKVIGAMREHGAELRLTDLDDKAAAHTPDEYKRLLSEAYEDLARAQLAFGCSSQEDVDMAVKYYDTIRASLGFDDKERDVRKL